MSEPRRPSLFIGSSKEGHEVAKSIQLLLDDSCEVQIWNQGVFGLSQGPLESLELALDRVDFAILVLTADDLIIRRGNEMPAARDNVLFELGLFVGGLGRNRTFIVHDRQNPPALPTDLAGITVAKFEPRSSGNLRAALGAACTQIQSAIDKLGSRDLERFESVADKHDSTHRDEADDSEQRPSGVTSRDEFHASPGRQTNEVFAIELLTRPITIELNENGHRRIIVDRHEVKKMLYSNEGKRATTERFVTHDNFDTLLELDRNVQAFLAGESSQSKMTIDLPTLGIPLRWASGGVLSIITDPSGTKWVPVFFRDIRPYGWNISLGTAERSFIEGDLVDPTYSLECPASVGTGVFLRVR